MGIPLSKSTPLALRLELLPRGAPGRLELESFVHESYARAFGADLREFMPLLMALRDETGRPLAVMGIRNAAQESLLLEHYLDTSIDAALGERTGRTVNRASIVELGNLAVSHAGAARWMIVALNAFLHGAGAEWVALTAIPALRNAFTRLDLELIELANADGTRLGEARKHWGRYYDCGPKVVAGNVEYGFARLDEVMRIEHACSLLPKLWACALRDGRASAVLQ